MVRKTRKALTGAAVCLMAVAGFAFGVSEASAWGTCATAYPTCWFDSECGDRCYQFECTSGLCDEMPSERDCSVCVIPGPPGG